MTSVTMPQVLAWRMRRQYLVDPAPDVVAVADRLCGVQAQVPSSAELAVSVRLGRPAGAELDAALRRDRTLVRMWAVRGTLHLLTARGAAAVCAVLGEQRTWDRPVVLRAVGVSREEMGTLLAAVAELLPGRVLTREELVAELTERISPHVAEVLRSGWGTLLKPAAAAGLLCHAPPDGPRARFTSPSTALAHWRPVDPADAGPGLVLDYLAAYGPATRDDFIAWLSRAVRTTPVTGWFARLVDEGRVARVEVDGAPAYLATEDVPELRDTAPVRGVRLLGGFDQYVIAVNRALVPAAHLAEVSRTAGWISAVVLHDGRVAGVWRIDDGRLTVELFEKVPARALAAEAERVTALLGVTAELVRT